LKHFRPKELVITGGSGTGETDEIFRLIGLMEVIDQASHVSSITTARLSWK